MSRNFVSQVNSSSILTSGGCAARITSEAACAEAVAATGASVSSSRRVEDGSLPAGCIMRPDQTTKADKMTYTAVYNTAEASTSTCNVPDGGSSPNVTALRGGSRLGDLELTLSHDTKSINISVTGPSDVWFGFGFGAAAMKDQPYAVIVDGEGAVTERKLADHSPGQAPSNTNKISKTIMECSKTS